MFFVSPARTAKNANENVGRSDFLNQDVNDFQRIAICQPWLGVFSYPDVFAGLLFEVKNVLS